MPKKLLKEFTDVDARAGGSDTSARTSRSDEGILALVNSVLQDVLGLNEETRSRMIKIIRNQGQWFDLKNTIRQLPSVAHRRLNDVINMSRSATTDVDTRNGESEVEFDQEQEDQYDEEGRPGYGESEKVTFAGYLINELTYDENDLRDPEQKQDIMRMMRASDAQADQLATRGNREQKQEQRQEITQEQDPQKSQLLRKKQTLLRQVAMIDAQIAGQDANKAAKEQY